MNKTFFKYQGCALFLILLLSLASCVKDRNGSVTLTDYPTVPEVAEISSPGFHALAFNLTNQPQTVNANVNIASPNPVSEDVTVTLALDPSALANYNAANGTAYTLIDPTAYSIPSYKVTIKKGQNLSSLPIIIYPDKVDLSKANAIPLKITDASGRTISQNFQSVIYAIVVKNKYDGDYHSTGYFQHPTAPRDINRDKHLATINANTNETEFGDLGTWLMQLTVNPDNSITFKPTGAANTTAALIPGDPVYNNTYDPATKTYKLKYGYPNPGPTRIITEFITIK
jgi:hypothetical protein